MQTLEEYLRMLFVVLPALLTGIGAFAFIWLIFAVDHYVYKRYLIKHCLDILTVQEIADIEADKKILLAENKHLKQQNEKYYTLLKSHQDLAKERI